MLTPVYKTVSCQVVTSKNSVIWSSDKIVWLQEEEEEAEKDGERSPGSDDCHIIPNDKSTEFILATVVEESV
jgi:hypothetical protein